MNINKFELDEGAVINFSIEKIGLIWIFWNEKKPKTSNEPKTGQAVFGIIRNSRGDLEITPHGSFGLWGYNSEFPNHFNISAVTSRQELQIKNNRTKTQFLLHIN